MAAATVVTSCLCAATSQAALLTTALDFSAPTQSMWGAGGNTANFGAEGSWGVGPFSFSYDIGASSGTVSAAFDGRLTVDYPSRSGTGRTNLNLSFQGDQNGGLLTSDFGAWAKAKLLGFDLLNQDYGLNIDKTFTPKIQASVSGSDQFSAANVGLDLVVAKGGASLNLEQTDRFSVSSIEGTVAYGKRGSSTINLMPFSLFSDGPLNLDVLLGSCGFWDFSVLDLHLDNTFALDFDTNLTVYEEHVDGIRFCKKCIGGICVPIPCGVSYDRNEVELASINVYNGAPFELAFNDIPVAGHFSIYVPEPGSFSLVSLAFACIGWIYHTRNRCNR